jgi:hypothetical protein
MASNQDWVVPASADERRYFVLDVSEIYRGNRAYFKKLYAQMDAGGLAAMVYDLLHRDISEFDHRTIPDTAALAEQKRHSLDTLDRWWLACLERGFIWRSRYGEADFAKWDSFYTTELLNRSYLQWCGDNRVSYPLSRSLLGKRMTEIYNPSRPRGENIIGEVEAHLRDYSPVVIKAQHQPGFIVDGLAAARAAFTQQRGVTFAPEPDESAEQGNDAPEQGEQGADVF